MITPSRKRSRFRVSVGLLAIVILSSIWLVLFTIAFVCEHFFMKAADSVDRVVIKIGRWMNIPADAIPSKKSPALD